MFCPQCGGDGQQLNSHCKRCGHWIPGGEGRRWYDSGKMSPDRTLKVMGGFSLFGAGLAFVCGVALFTALFMKKGLHFVAGLVALYCILLAVYQLLTFITARGLRRRLESARRAELKGGLDAPALEAPRHAQAAAPSSTSERTTELLEPAPARRPEGGEPR